LRKQCRTGRTSPPGIIGAVLTAEVPEPGRGEQRIARCMSNRVAVGMAGQAALTWPVQPSQMQFAPVAEWMHIDADADPR